VQVACCQVRLAVGDLDGNRERVRQSIEAAAGAGARVIVVPELADSGYVFTDATEAWSLAEPVEGPTVTGWVRLARRLDIVLVGGFCELDPDGQVRNSAVLIDATGVRALYRKVHLWDREKLVFTPGDAAPPVVDTAYGRIAVMVCYDLEFPEWVRLAALRGAQLLCAPVNWPLLPRPEGERPSEIVRAQAAAATNRMFIAVADRVGDERGVGWVGGSVLIDPDGWPVTDLTIGNEATVTADLDLDLARQKQISEHNDVHADRRPELYTEAPRRPAACSSGDINVVAIVQQPPSVLDLEAGVARAADYVAQAAQEGARLVAFPETWLTTYPAWVFGMAGWDDAEAKRWYGRLLEQSPTIDDPRLAPLTRAAARHQVTVVIGLNERARPHAGTLYNSLVTIGPDGRVQGVHRKLTPTHTERVIWAPGDAAGLRVHDTPVGRVGGLICWEHWHPLARQALHVQDEQIHVAAWPDFPDMHRVASRAYAFEGRCFVLCAAQYLSVEDVPGELREAFRAGVGPDAPHEGLLFTGGSGVIGPDGAWVTPPLEGQPGIVYAPIDLARIGAEKHDLDVAGHYGRPDLLRLVVDRRPQVGIEWAAQTSGANS
jgi:predicted amidohydrolase